MTTTYEPSVKELYPELDSYMDEEGDYHSIDDDPEGFNAVGHTPKSADFYSGDAIVDDRYGPEHESDQLVDLPELLLAAKAFAHANQMAGLVAKQLRHRLNYRPAQNERERMFALGTHRYKRAVGHSGLKAMAIAEGIDPDQFEHDFGIARNNFYRMNKGETGQDYRKNLEKVSHES